VIQFQNHDDARANVETEADALAAIVRDNQALGAPEADRVRGAVATYVRAVVQDEWPRLRAAGQESPRAAAALDSLYQTLQGIEPRTFRARAFYDDSVRQLNIALDARRNRLADGRGGLPAEVAALILVGAVAILSYATLVGSRSFWFHAIGAGAIAVVIGVSLVVLVALLYPFSGDLAIDPEPFRSGSLARFFGPS